MTTTDKAVPASGLSATPPRKTLSARFLQWEWFLVFLILLVVIVNSSLSPYFLNVDNLARTSSDFMEMGLMMLPMVFIILTGNVDLSVASILGMTASCLGLLHMNGVDIWLAAAIAMALGALAGLLNGYLITRLKVPAIVITLGTYAFYRGIAYVMLGDQAARGYPDAFTFLGQGQIPGTPFPFSLLLFGVMAVIFGLVLHKTAFGRYLYAIGHNQEAVAYSGVSVSRVKMIIFLLSGLMSALAGLVLAARFGSTRPDIGLGLELSVITATVLGGVDINGGKGSMIGAILALLLVGLMRFGMGLVNIQGQVQSTAIGFLLIFSILLPSLATTFKSTRLRLNLRSILFATVIIAAFVAFIVFFLWTRAIVFSLS